MKICPVCRRNWDDDFRICPIDGLPLQAVAESDPYRGTSVGRLKIGDRIADGSLGPVYRAESPDLGVVAVQFISEDRLSSPVLMEAFEDAVKLAAKLNHPNVIRTYCLERAENGSAAVVMEYVEGDTLDGYRGNHPALDLQQACRIVREAAEGVLAAHRMSMLHGSLHPSRILVTPSGNSKVGGFHRSGLRDDPFTSGVMALDIRYIAPERTGIIRDVTVPDYRADVYSLGVILYEIVAGKLPYEARSIQELGAAMELSPEPASLVNSQVSATLSRVILKAISKYPGDRHRSVEEFIRELEAARQPMREPERVPHGGSYDSPPIHGRPDDSEFFEAGPLRPGMERGEERWPAAGRPGRKGEGTMFSWFRTRARGRSAPREFGGIRAKEEDSSVSRGAYFPRKEESDERTVLVSGRRRAGGSIFESFSVFRRHENGTGTDMLPRRRLSSRAYVCLWAIAIAVAFGIVSLFLFFSGPGTGKLTVESMPSGARVYLNGAYQGNTKLTIPEVKEGEYRLRLDMDGYESVESSIEVKPNSDIVRPYLLTKQESLPPAIQAALAPPAPAAAPPAAAPESAGNRPSYETTFQEALRSGNYFPPGIGNAWEVLQAWQKAEGPSPSHGLDQARRTFCSDLEALGGTKLEQKDFKYVRGLLEQIRTRMLGINCAGGLQARFDAAISRSISDLKSSLNAALSRQDYVTPESDNALKYVRLILNVDPQESEAKAREAEIFTQALAQARMRSAARDHQEALNIYTQLLGNYPKPPGGSEALNRAVERERQKISLLGALKTQYRVQVRHGHPFLRSFWFGKRECAGTLILDGFTIEFQTAGEHAFKITYEQLSSESFVNGKLTLEGSAIPDGRIVLDQAEKNPNPSLAELYAKIEEFKRLRAQYLSS